VTNKCANSLTTSNAILTYGHSIVNLIEGDHSGIVHRSRFDVLNTYDGNDTTWLELTGYALSQHLESQVLQWVLVILAVTLQQLQHQHCACLSGVIFQCVSYGHFVQTSSNQFKR
jgi:hypothetical protein